MNRLALKSVPTLKSFIHELDIQISDFDLNRCDERTLYITISLQFKGYKTVCDLIYLVDKDELFGAISLNEKFDSARSFIFQHFNHKLLYGDELFIAETIRKTPTFKQYLKKYAETYPKHMKQKFFN